MNPIIVAHDLAGLSGAGKSACMSLIKDLGGYSEIMADNSALSTTGLCIVEMRFSLKRGSPAIVGTMPWQGIALCALDKLNAAARDSVLRSALAGTLPDNKAATEQAVEAMRTAMRIVNGSRPGNITGTISGTARFS